MLKNYFKVAFRNLIYNKTYSFINIGGLALGIATSLLIVLWIADELSYDRHHEHAENIYRTTVSWKTGGKTVTYPTTPAPLAELVRQKIPEVKNVTRFLTISSALFTYQEQPFNEKHGVYTDPATLAMFTFHFLEGNQATALSQPASVVLSKSLAEKYFGKGEALGKTLRLENTYDLVVTGVIADMPENTHLPIHYLLPFELLYVQNPQMQKENWDDFNYNTYVQLEKNTGSRQVEAKITQAMNIKDSDNIGHVSLQPLPDIHLYSTVDTGDAGSGDIQYIYIFAAVAFFVLVIACINFMNLATARSVKRSKEIGLRKTIGAAKYQLIGQFLGEALLFTGIAVLLAVLLVEMVLPFYNELAQKQITLHLLDGSVIGLLLCIGLITALAAGLYPAIFLSSFQPVKVLKGTFQAGKGGVLLRQTLVVLQFSLSIILIVSTLVINDQLNYIMNKKLGFEKDNILILPLSGNLSQNYNTFRDELSKQPGVLHTTVASQDLNNVGSSTNSINWQGKQEDDRMMINQLAVDLDFIETFNIHMVEGRGFSRERRTDSAAFILNEAAIQQMGITNPIGFPLEFHGVKGAIIGVAENFHFQTVHKAVEPLVLFVNSNWWSQVYIKIDGRQTKDAVAAIEKEWKNVNPAYPFEYRFLDESFDKLYKSELRTGQLFDYFAFIAIFISFLGLYGLAAYTAELRTKEIGVRKVLGASVSNILLMFSRDFIKLVFIAFAIAAPVAYWLMRGWLEDFAYKTEIGFTVFLLAVVFAVTISLLTVGYQSLRAAIANPVDSLKRE